MSAAVTTVATHIRPLRPDDVDQVVRLSLAAFEPIFASFRQVLGPRIYARIYPDWKQSQVKGVREVCTDGDNITVWVAEEEGKAGQARTITGYIAYSLHPVQKKGRVELIAVDPDYQNRGIGTALNTFALDRMRESGMELAEVGTGGDPGHAPARRSYEKAGYSPLPLVRYYKARETASLDPPRVPQGPSWRRAPH